MVPRLQNQVQRVARVVEKTFNLRYLGQYDWGLFEARAYDEKVNPLFMDFGPDKRFWYGPGALPAGSGGDNAVNCSTCSPTDLPGALKENLCFLTINQRLTVMSPGRSVRAFAATGELSQPSSFAASRHLCRHRTMHPPGLHPAATRRGGGPTASFCAPATPRSSTLPAAFSEPARRQPIWRYRRTGWRATAAW